MISIIIVAYNEEILISSIINYLKQQKFSGEFEIILADGGSSDKTVSIAQKQHVSIVQSEKGKAFQMNKAAKAASGEILFFVHADMILAENTLQAIQETINNGYDAGGFANTFSEYNSKIKSTGKWMNLRFFDKREQSDKGIFYGDNGIFVKRKVFESLGGFKEILIMEDYDFSVRLNNNGYKTFKIKSPPIIVSARRHINAGFIKTRFQWVVIRTLYKWGLPSNRLAKWYADVR